ncbi:MAG: hypothetical protein O3B01_22045 [Planctomycetota bacterium]|nr:hypothetical protein [Planctomycetota bacterium]MDA1141254.1 hypothetical protein [Planctomycetota bacterium]
MHFESTGLVELYLLTFVFRNDRVFNIIYSVQKFNPLSWRQEQIPPPWSGRRHPSLDDLARQAIVDAQALWV